MFKWTKLDKDKKTTLEGVSYKKITLEDTKEKTLEEKSYKEQNLGGEENATPAAIYVQHSQLGATDKCKNIYLNTSFSM